jgi:putative transposase
MFILSSILQGEVNIMPGPKPPEIHLTDEERQGLERLVHRHRTPQQIALRARIVLAAAEGKNNAHIARELAIGVLTARRWRGRWLTLQPIRLTELSIEERLEDLPRSGAPPRITAEQVCRIVALACEAPEDSDRPISHWTDRELADEVMKRGIVDQISPRHAARLLKRGRPQTPPGTLLADASSR